MAGGIRYVLNVRSPRSHLGQEERHAPADPGKLRGHRRMKAVPVLGRERRAQADAKVDAVLRLLRGEPLTGWPRS